LWKHLVRRKKAATHPSQRISRDGTSTFQPFLVDCLDPPFQYPSFSPPPTVADSFQKLLYASDALKKPQASREELPCGLPFFFSFSSEFRNVLAQRPPTVISLRTIPPLVMLERAAGLLFFPFLSYGEIISVGQLLFFLVGTASLFTVSLPLSKRRA